MTIGRIGFEMVPNEPKGDRTGGILLEVQKYRRDTNRSLTTYRSNLIAVIASLVEIVEQIDDKQEHDDHEMLHGHTPPQGTAVVKPSKYDCTCAQPSESGHGNICLFCKGIIR